MGYMYHGVELVNCSPPRQRKGPLTKFTFGKYVGERVEDIIRKDPRYIMWCVKEWLDVSPQQAFLFEDVTGGGIIPDEYIVNRKEKTVLIPDSQESPKDRGKQYWWEDDYDLPCWPDWDYWGIEKPKWWSEFLQRAKTLTMSQAKDLYGEYQIKDVRRMREEWMREYDEYRKTRSKE